MSLRDDILKEQEKEAQELAAKKAEEKAREEQRKKEEKEAEEKASKIISQSLAAQKEHFLELKRDLKKGIVPHEWVEFYDTYLSMLKKNLKNFNGSSFEFEFPATKKVYDTYFYSKPSEQYSPGILLNEYLSTRLKKEGFFNVHFALESYFTTFSTREDEIAYEVESEAYHKRSSEAFREYDKKYAEWSAKNAVYTGCQSTGGINNPSHPGSPPQYPCLPAPRMGQSGKKYHYCVKIKAGLFKNAGKKKKKKEPFKINIPPFFMGLIILGACWVISLVLMLTVPAWRDPLLEIWKEYPLTYSLGNLSHYEEYLRFFGYGFIPMAIYYFFAFL